MRRPIFFVTIHSLVLLLISAAACAPADAAQNPFSGSVPQTSAPDQLPQYSDSPNAEEELRAGVGLTQRGQFSEAIPHFLAAKGRVGDEYAVEFNLALCYVATSQFPQAIRVLTALRRERTASVNIENLLAQAYIGDGQAEQSMKALQRAASLDPKNEKLYGFVADACADHRDYEFGMRVLALALHNLPDSARLHYQRGYFLAMLDRFDDAKPEFALAVSLAPHSEVAFLAAAQQAYFSGNMAETIHAARTGIQQGYENYLLLTMLGDALIRSGAAPGTPEFEEARGALEKATELRPGYVMAQIALGNILEMDNQAAAAAEHFEKARQLDPRNPSVYSHLAVAYRRLGKPRQADAMLATLAQLNAEQAAKINSAPGERKPIPGSTASVDHLRP
ncbi:MAG: tetratricopeptide repeat protein [Candidatus Acidiferrum sp.]